MLGTIVNVLAILAGGALGLLGNKWIPEKLGEALMKGLGLCVLYIGISGSLCGENTLVLILSIIFGILMGELADLDGKINRLGKWCEKKMAGFGGKMGNLSEGFVGASLLFCVGAMAILGPLQSGLTGDHTVLFTKSLMDGVAAIIFASTWGVGVLLSGSLVLLYQGAITLLAQWISPLLSDAVINEMSCAGYLLIVALALNMLGITKIKVMNYVPAVFLPILLCQFL